MSDYHLQIISLKKQPQHIHHGRPARMRVLRPQYSFLFLLTLLLTLLPYKNAYAAQSTFTNPLFTSADPWVTYRDGNYYYSESISGSVYVRKSATLTGLANAQNVKVFTPGDSSHNQDVWAPELHYVNNAWYIYYAADDGQDVNHRIYVAQADTGDPQGSYTDKGEIYEPSDDWAIDPDVFTFNNQLYLLWSGKDNKTNSLPQNTYIAPMSDPLHITGSKTAIGTPTQAWEKRTGAIQEGPIGYVRNGKAYVTYSASASWTTDYSVGLLTNTNGNLTDPQSWTKTGPFFDHHGTAYGPGSVVFVQSPDGTQWWNLYHGIDSTSCSPAYTCRDIRLQEMWWDDDDTPELGYPVNPQVQETVPSGENGSSGGGATREHGWGDAFGDSAEGNTTNGLRTGNWTVNSASGASGSTLGTGWQQIFRGNPNFENYTVSAQMQWVQTGTDPNVPYPKYGIYADYDDNNNRAEVFIDLKSHVLATHAVVGGNDQGWRNTDLPNGFDQTQYHTVKVTKSGSTFTFFLDDSQQQQRDFNLFNGQIGLVTEDTKANYQNVEVTNIS